MIEEVKARVKEASAEGELPCAKALAIAQELGVSPLKVGEAADALGVRISKCQLGLFGYGPRAEGKHRIVQASSDVPAEWAYKLRGAASPAGDLPCASAHRIARQLGVSYLSVGNAAEGLGLHISQCQLGCFP